MEKTEVYKKLLMYHLMLLFFLCSFMKIECALSTFDKITRLPGQPQVGFQQYSGYVVIDKNNKNEKAFFYYFVEAENDPASKPLVLWFNGGPGTSSVGIGAFSENGPFKTNGNVLVKNNCSWNSEANMLYFETPAGVGFSYSTNSSRTKMNDVLTARDNLVFLKRWFIKFPQYRQRDLFVMGESYAGHYIPHLAQLMSQSNNKQKVFNLKGIALGNPALDFVTDFNSKAEFLWSHGVISDATYNIFTSVCNYSRYMSEIYRDSVSSSCSGVMGEVNKETSKFVDTHDVTLDVCISSVFAQSKVISPQKVDSKIPITELPLLNPYRTFTKKHNPVSRVVKQVLSSNKAIEAKELVLASKLEQVPIPSTEAEQVFPIQLGESLPAQWHAHGYTHLHFGAVRMALTLHGRKGLPVVARMALLDTRFEQYAHVSTDKIDVCSEDETANYLNRKDVQKALHARLVGVKKWEVTSNILDYDLLDVEKPTISLVGSLVKEGIPVLIYSGDQDSVLPLTGSRTLVHGLAKQLGLNTTVPYRVWFQGKQVGGWTQVYGNILSYATVRGAAHEVPFSQPERSLLLLKSFLKSRPLPEKFS